MEFDHLPIIPHESVASVDCCGCLMVEMHGDEASIVCNEFGDVIRTLAVKDVESAMQELSQTDTICSAVCTHCGALNKFPGMSAIIAFICSECGEGVDVSPPIQ